ncbi:MAG TPA: acyl-CoA dehydrogenase family protein [Chloroflexota bacterium]|nr:acyl-CoA dehydrogenase family protein [Chloroflexota bacterium]
MQFTPEHQMFRHTVRDVVQREIDPYVDDWEAAHAFPAHELFPKLAALGLFGLEYEPADGGQGVDHGFTVILGEELGRARCGGVPMAIAVHTDMATPSLARYGSPELKARYLAPALRGEQVAAVAVTEPDAGSDVAAISCRAVRDGDDWVINGSKLYITNGVQADWLCLLVRTSSDERGYRGMSQVVFPTSTPGFSVSRTLRKLGNHSSDTAELSFVDARVPLRNTIGQIGRGFQQQMQQFQNERLIAAYMAVGQCDAALERTVAYLRQRLTFGKPLVEHQWIQYHMAELVAEVDLLRHYNYAAATTIMAGQDASRFATIAKLTAGRLVRKVADTCLQFHGGIGYMDETWTSRFYRDSRLLSIGGGTDEIMLNVLARMDGITALD